MIERILEEPSSFEFFQGVRLLEAHGFTLASEEERSRGLGLGGDEPARREIVRFRVQPTLAFPVAPLRKVQRVSEPGARSPFEVQVTFLGLIGPSGVLPQAYTELVLKRLQRRDDSLRDFLDAFQHRAIAFFWRAWLKYRVPFAWEREQRRIGREDAFTRAIWSLVGLGSPHLRSRTGLDDAASAYFSGHLAHRPRTAEGLADMLSDLFGVPVRIEQFVGRWLVIEPGDLSRMPDRENPRGRNNQLGGGFVLGSRVWDVQSKIRIHAGPMSYADFAALTPGAAGQERMRALVDTYLGIGTDAEVRVTLAPGAAPMLKLSAATDRRDETAPAARLGLNTFVQGRKDVARERSALFALVS